MKSYRLKKSVAWMLSALMISPVLSACSSNEQDTDRNIEYLPVQLRNNGNWSFISKDGKLYFEDQFSYEPTLVVNGLFSMEGERGFGLYRIDNGSVKLINNLNNLTFVGESNGELLPICRPGERISVINTQGETQFVLSPVNEKEIKSCSYHFEDDMLGVMDEEHKFGFFDNTGKCVIAPMYDITGAFSEGKAVVHKDSIWSIIDKTGETLFTLKKGQVPVCDWKYRFNKLCTRDSIGHQYYVYDEKGEMRKLPESIYSIEDFDDEYIIYRPGENGKWGLWSAKEQRGVMTFAGEIIISPYYNFLCFGEDNKLLASRDGHEWELKYYSDMKAPIHVYSDEVNYIVGFGYISRENKYEAVETDNYYLLNKKGEVFYREVPFKAYGQRLWSGSDMSQYLMW